MKLSLKRKIKYFLLDNIWSVSYGLSEFFRRVANNAVIIRTDDSMANNDFFLQDEELNSYHFYEGYPKK